jgi:hypothetical protein
VSAGEDDVLAGEDDVLDDDETAGLALALALAVDEDVAADD